MQELKKGEINMFIEMIKTSIDCPTKNRLINKSRNLSLKYSIRKDAVISSPSDRIKTQPSIINQLSLNNQRLQQQSRKKFNKSANLDLQNQKGRQKQKEKQRSFYEMYNEDVVKKIKDDKCRGKNKNIMRISRYRPMSISEVHNIKLKSFQFDPKLPQQQIIRYLKSDQIGPIKRQINKKKQNQKYKSKPTQQPKQKQKDSNQDRFQIQYRYQSCDKSICKQHEISYISKVFTPKSGADLIQGRRKQFTKRLHLKNIPKGLRKNSILNNQQPNNNNSLNQNQKIQSQLYIYNDNKELKRLLKLNIKQPKYKHFLSKTPQPIRLGNPHSNSNIHNDNHNLSSVKFNFKKTEEIKIDPWVINQDD